MSSFTITSAAPAIGALADSPEPDYLRPDQPGLETQCIRGGLSPDLNTGALVTPIFQTTTYAQEAVGRDKGFTYSRTANPTVAALEAHLGAIEDALPAVAFASGLAATTALCLSELRAGDSVVVSDVVYGGTVRLLNSILQRFGVRAVFVDSSNLTALNAAVAEARPRFVFVESPANPTLKLTDIAAAAEIASAHGADLVVDNTFLTAALQRPLDLGADVVLYSTTKYIEGHNSTIGGALLTRDEAQRARFKFTQNAIGSTQAPFDAWLTIRGLKTLPIRAQAHSENALAVARWLECDSRVERVFYPWLESFPQQALALRQQAAGGGMISFQVRGGVAAGVRLMNSVRLCTLAENLGAVETLITHPASMTHADVPAEDRRAAGISDALVRLSVGLESPEDIIADLDQALAAAVST